MTDWLTYCVEFKQVLTQHQRSIRDYQYYFYYRIDTEMWNILSIADAIVLTLH